MATSDHAPVTVPLDFDEMDRTVARSFNSFEDAEQADREFWLSRTPEERLSALEHFRRVARGYDDAEPEPPFQKVVTVAQLRGS